MLNKKRDIVMLQTSLLILQIGLLGIQVINDVNLVGPIVLIALINTFLAIKSRDAE